MSTNPNPGCFTSSPSAPTLAYITYNFPSSAWMLNGEYSWGMRKSLNAHQGSDTAEKVLFQTSMRCALKYAANKKESTPFFAMAKPVYDAVAELSLILIAELPAALFHAES